MLRFNFTIAWRNIRKNKVFSSINIVGLALSMACCLAISMYVWNETHYDTFHRNRANIYRITSKQDQAGKLYNVAVTPGPLAPALQKDFPEIQNTVRLGNWSGALKHGRDVFDEQHIQLTENSIFSIFNFPVIKGNPAAALLSPDEIVITEKTAVKYFGENWKSAPSLLGEVFTLNGQTSFKLAAIVANPPANSSIQFDVLLPVAFLFQTDKWSNEWGSNSYHTYLQLKPSTNVAAFEAKLAKQFKVYKPETSDLLQLQPLSQQYLHSNFDFFTDWGKRGEAKYVRIFTGIGILLLIIACVNFINLSTARSLKRSMEVGIRKVNGASRKQLIAQFLSESVLFAVIAGVIAVMVLALSQNYLEQLTGALFAFSFTNKVFYAFFLISILVIGLIAGIYPALVLSAFKPVKILKGSFGTKSGAGFRKALVVLQFSIAVGMIVCTCFMYRQLMYIQQHDLGFKPDQIIKIGLGGALRGKEALLKQDLAQDAAFIAVAPATMSLANVDNSSDIEWDGMQPTEKFLVTQANVDPDFIPALGMQLVQGNNFQWQGEKDSANHFIVNETAVKMMGTTNAKVIGKKVIFWGAKGDVVGVVKDFHFKPLRAGIEPFIFRYQPWAPYFNLFVKVAPGKTAEAIARLQQYYKKYEPELPMQYAFLNESINELYKTDQRTASILSLFAFLTIFIGCLGLFGLTVYAAEQRVKEIGIRKVLGANVLSVVQLLSKDFLLLVIIAVIIALPVAWYASSQWLQNYAYRVELSWWIFLLAGVLVLVLALVTIATQAVKAAVANPVKSLRTE